MTAIKEAARGYLDGGWVPIPVQYKGKNPTVSEWQKRTTDSVNVEEEFYGDMNVGILLGEPSGGLVDIDLDCDHAIRSAEHFLPATYSIFGRPSKLRSHHIYQVEDSGGTVKLVGPGNEGTLVEYRAAGGQTVFPPSVHVSGEQISFASEGDPARVQRGELLVAVKQLAAASLLASHWNPGSRHNMSMALAGGLLKAGWGEGKVEHFIQGVCIAANDNEPEDRLRAVSDTVHRLFSERETTGWPRLSEMIGERVVEQVMKWLGIQNCGDRPGIGHNLPPANDNNVTRNDTGNGQRFRNQHGNGVRFAKGLGWIAWGGKYWITDAMFEVTMRAQETAQSIFSEARGIEGDREREDMEKWANQSLKSSAVKAMLEMAKPHLLKPSDELDTNPMLLNCENGTLDLATGKLQDFKRGDFLTKIAPVKYNPDAACPSFKSFLEQIMGGDQDLVEFIQRAVGYCLTGRTDEQSFFIAHGTGANGKTTLLSVVSELLGDYAQSTPFETFLAKRSPSPTRDDLVRMKGVRFITASESGAGQKFDEATIKEITGGGEIAARGIYQKHIEFIPECKIWVTTNHKPEISGDDPAIWRRLKLIPFKQTIPEPDQDKDLLPKLLKELPGVLAWAVRGCLAWQEGGLKPPVAVTAATETYRSEMDHVERFATECLLPSPGNVERKAVVYDEYEGWTEDQGYDALAKGKLTTRLKGLGFVDGRSRTHGRHWKNLAIRNDLAEEFEDDPE